MKKLKVGIIGCGGIANGKHLPSLAHQSHRLEIVAFCDIIEERATALRDKYYPDAAVYTDYKELLKDESIDAVDICTPNYLHSIIAVDAFKAGKHVLCEKPAARILSEALEMQKVAHETGKILNIGVVNRFNTYVMKIRELIMQQTVSLINIYHQLVYIVQISGIQVPVV